MHSARYLLFVSVWSAVIYSPIARWSWYSEGWSHQLGSMDFAGGTPVHIASGAAVAAMSIFYFFESNGWQRAYLHLSSVTKKRINENLPWAAAMWVKSWLFNTSPWLPKYKQADIIPGRSYEVYDVNQAIFGTGLLWFGWYVVVPQSSSLRSPKLPLVRPYLIHSTGSVSMGVQHLGQTAEPYLHAWPRTWQLALAVLPLCSFTGF